VRSWSLSGRNSGRIQIGPGRVAELDMQGPSTARRRGAISAMSRNGHLGRGSPTMPNGSRLTRRDVGLRGSGGRLIERCDPRVPIRHLGPVLALTILGLALTSYEIRHARLSPAKTQIIPIQIAHLRIPHLQVLRIAARNTRPIIQLIDSTKRR
jgi:hypothetical protein